MYMLYMYTYALFDLQLQFEKGELIAVTRMVDGGWWEGICNGRSGWFPGNYVEKATGMCATYTIYMYMCMNS